MKIKRKIPMYIAVQLESGDKRIWLPLPATRTKFDAALEKIGARSNGDFHISDYAHRVPLMSVSKLMKTPLSVVNHLASRLNKLSDDEILKFCAVNDTDYYFETVGRIIDFTYQTNEYTLLPGINDEEALGVYYIGDRKHIIAEARIKQCIDRREFGKSLAEMENGVFTPHGYLSSKIGWDLPSTTGRPVPDSLWLKGYLGEEIYGNWEESEYGA
jgi:hypothetical protein